MPYTSLMEELTPEEIERKRRRGPFTPPPEVANLSPEEDELSRRMQAGAADYQSRLDAKNAPVAPAPQVANLSPSDPREVGFEEGAFRFGRAGDDPNGRVSQVNGPELTEYLDSPHYAPEPDKRGAQEFLQRGQQETAARRVPRLNPYGTVDRMASEVDPEGLGYDEDGGYSAPRGKQLEQERQTARRVQLAKLDPNFVLSPAKQAQLESLERAKNAPVQPRFDPDTRTPQRKNYEYAVSNGYKGTPMQWDKEQANLKEPGDGKLERITTTNSKGEDVITFKSVKEGDEFKVGSTADMRNKALAREQIENQIPSLRLLSKNVISRVGPMQRIMSTVRSAESVMGKDPIFRAYQDSRKSMASQLAVMTQGTRPSDYDSRDTWLPMVPDVFSDTDQSAEIKWLIIDTAVKAGKGLDPAVFWQSVERILSGEKPEKVLQQAEPQGGGGTGKVATAADVAAFAQQAGVSEDQARQAFTSKGYAIQ